MNTETKIQIIEISSSDDDEEEEGEGEKEEEKEKPFSESLEEKKLLSRNTLTILAAAEEDDDDDDCVILDYDPFADIDVSKKLSIKEEEFDILILSEKGKVACRDYPHSRHLCAVFPFVVTPHENHCSQCFCYICEILAPCNYWSEDITGHCHATEHDPVWKTIRQSTPASNNS